MAIRINPKTNVLFCFSQNKWKTFPCRNTFNLKWPSSYAVRRNGILFEKWWSDLRPEIDLCIFSSSPLSSSSFFLKNQYLLLKLCSNVTQLSVKISSIIDIYFNLFLMQESLFTNFNLIPLALDSLSSFC